MKLQHTLSAKDMHLLSVPIDNPERNRLRDVIRFEGEKLASKAAKFLTLAEEYSRRRTFRREQEKPPYRPNVLCGTRQLPALPFETGRSVLPGMEQWLELL